MLKYTRSKSLCLTQSIKLLSCYTNWNSQQSIRRHSYSASKFTTEFLIPWDFNIYLFVTDIKFSALLISDSTSTRSTFGGM